MPIIDVGGGPGAALVAAGFDLSKRTLFLMEGLTPYLEPPAIDEILSFVRTCAPGSLLASTWINNELEMANEGLKEIVEARNTVAAVGEPFKFFLPSARGQTEHWVKVRSMGFGFKRVSLVFRS